MKTRFVLLITLTALLGSCEFDYSLKIDDQQSFTPKVVVNSVFSPNDNIDIRFGWSHQSENQNNSLPPSGAVSLYEEGELVAESNINDEGVAYLSYIPSADKSYHFIADINDYGIVKGESYIPLQGNATGTMGGCQDLDNLENKTICGISINSITPVPELRCVWVRLVGGYKFSDEYNDIYFKNNGNFLPDRIYSNNIYIDNFNLQLEQGGELFDGYGNIYGGISYYARMIRIANDLLSLSLPLELSMMFNGIASHRVYISPERWEYRDLDLTHISAEIIYPSDDYDKYIKNIYRQSELSFDPYFPLFSDVVYVESNIENGLGVFAGYNSSFIDIENK